MAVLRRRPAWEDLCRRLFVRPHESGKKGHGVHRGLRVQIDWRGFEWFRFFFDPPLGLGLRLSEKLVPRRSRAGRGVVVTGDVEFDRRVRLAADEPERAAALFDTDVRRGFLAVRKIADLTIRDDRLQAVLTLRWRDRFDDVFARLADLRSALERSRDAVPPPAVVAGQLPAWTALAERTGRPLWAAPLRLSTRIHGHEVELSTRRVGPGQHRFAVRTRASTPLGVGLVIARQSALSPLASLVRGRDHEVGRPEVDRRFVIRFAGAGEAPTRIVDDEVCRDLEALCRARTLRIEDGFAEATFDCRPDDERGAPDVAETLVRLQERLRANARGRSGAGSAPYR